MIIWMVKKKKRKVEKWSLLVENQVPRDDVDTQLVPQGRLPRVLVGTKGIPLRRCSLLRDAEIGAIDCHCAVVEHVVHAQPALEDNLRLRGRWGRGGEDRILGKNNICID